MVANLFLSVDASATVADVLALLADRGLDTVVVRDEDEVYVVRTADVEAAARAGVDTMGALVGDAAHEPVEAVEIGSALEGAMLPAHRVRPDTVLMADGVVSDVIGPTVSGGGGDVGAPPDAFAEAAPPEAAPPGAGAGSDSGSALVVAVDHPESVVLGEIASLVIALSGDVASEAAIPIVADAGDEIDVVVSPSAGFVVDGRPDGRLVVGGDASSSPGVEVRVRATELGLGRIVIYAFRAGEALGSLTIAPEVVAAGARAEAVPATATTGLAGQGRPAADLELIIFDQPSEGGGRELLYRLSSRDESIGLNLKPFGPVVLEGGPGAYFTDLYKQIEELPLRDDAQRAAATERLQAMGSELFASLLPPDLQLLMWELQERIATVWVQSEEPWVPWELCRLQGKRDRRIVEGPFFCEAFELTRWIPGIPRLPELRLSNIGLIVPAGSGLTSADGEKAMVHALATNGRKVIDVPADYVGVRQALATGTLDAIHFAGHASFRDQSNPAKSEIELEGGSLRPTDISGDTANLGLAKPLVFLNACQAGRQSRGLTGVGGWATSLLRAGAGAFVGAHWEVTDDIACRFATTFYEHLLAGTTIAGAARGARLAVREGGDPTWLAYTVFGDPGARVAHPSDGPIRL